MHASCPQCARSVTRTPGTLYKSTRLPARPPVQHRPAGTGGSAHRNAPAAAARYLCRRHHSPDVCSLTGLLCLCFLIGPSWRSKTKAATSPNRFPLKCTLPAVGNAWRGKGLRRRRHGCGAIADGTCPAAGRQVTPTFDYRGDGRPPVASRRPAAKRLCRRRASPRTSAQRDVHRSEWSRRGADGNGIRGPISVLMGPELRRQVPATLAGAGTARLWPAGSFGDRRCLRFARGGPEA